MFGKQNVLKYVTRSVIAACLFVTVSMLTGCETPEQNGNVDTQGAETSAYATYADVDNMDFEYSKRDMNPSYEPASATRIVFADGAAVVEGKGAEASGTQVEIASEGTYVVSGFAPQGQLSVNLADENAKVQIVLNGADIHNDNGPAVLVKQADKVFLTLADGTENTLSDGSAYEAGTDTEEDAVVFSHDDLTINGNGKLSVEATYNDAIASNDDLLVTGGDIDILSVGCGLKGKDSLRILDGTFDIESGKHCLRSSKDTDPTKGYISIDGGEFALSAGKNAVKAETYLRMKGGAVNVAVCEEGFESMVVRIDGGDIDIASEDDGINASAPGSSSEAQTPAMNNGARDTKDAQPMPPVREDDTGARPSERPADIPNGPSADSTEGREKPPAAPEGGGSVIPGEGNGNCKVIVNGGSIYIVAQGDVIDSNGSVEVNGGMVLSSGPSNDGNGALDYATDATCNGGTVIMTGAAGMAQSFMSGTQPFALVKIEGRAGEKMEVLDGNGTLLAEYTPSLDYDIVLISLPGFVAGQEYSVGAGKVTVQFVPDVFKQNG